MVGGLVALIFLFSLSDRANAIPPFARQLGVDCTQCHTVWPRLNAFGRQFKIRGYTDRSPLGNRWLPFAVRVKIDGESNTSWGPGSPAATTRNINFPDDFNLFEGGAITERFGDFIQITGGRSGNSYPVVVDTVRFAYNLSNQSRSASATIFKDGLFGADPYPSLGGMSFTPFSTDAAFPMFLTGGFLFDPLDGDNYGIVYHTYLDTHSHWYGAVGVENGGGIPDALAGTSRTTTQAVKYYTRFAYESTVGDKGGTWNLGGAYAAGNVNVIPTVGSGVPSYNGRASRFFLDGALQLPLRKNDMFELVGLYSTGSDRHVIEFNPGVGINGPFNANVSGLYLQSDYYWHGNFGPQVYYDHTVLGPTTYDTYGAGLVWLPQRDFKIGLSALLTDGSDGSHNRTYGLYLTKLFYKPIEELQKEEREERQERLKQKTQPSPMPSASPSTEPINATGTPDATATPGASASPKAAPSSASPAPSPSASPSTAPRSH
jgi:hypothetical protein